MSHKQTIEKKDLVSFGLIWAAIFLGLSLYPFFKHYSFSQAPQLIQTDIHLQIHLGFFAIFLLISLGYPKALTAFYKVWIKVGEIIGGMVSKVILIIMFYLLFTPVALLLRLFRKDLLHKRLDKQASSYWLKREQQPQSLKNQF